MVHKLKSRSSAVRLAWGLGRDTVDGPCASVWLCEHPWLSDPAPIVHRPTPTVTCFQFEQTLNVELRTGCCRARRSMFINIAWTERHPSSTSQKSTLTMERQEVGFTKLFVDFFRGAVDSTYKSSLDQRTLKIWGMHWTSQ